MEYGFVAPFADARDLSEYAALAESHGWDGVFVAESVWGVDAWVALAAAAMTTQRLRLGTLLTPVSRWKPWDLASRVGTVDRLSGGRAIMSTGLGALHDGWLAFEADEGRRQRAEKVDECLAVYDGLMRGQPFSFEGAHYTAHPTTFYPPDPPVQRPRPPVWVVGAHMVGRPRQPSLERAARWDGLLPQVVHDEQRGKPQMDDFVDVVARVRRMRADAGLPWEGYDVIVEGDSTGDFVQLDPASPQAWEQAGATWWIECWWSLEPGPEGAAELRRRLAAGPPS
jgi:alkanesulfonate monooxygenase SsuD/methylene tetrahydromethanopterin reductase-like flavin-dependent oxidoreductase (luciferase family)